MTATGPMLSDDCGSFQWLLARTHNGEEVPGSTLTNAFYHADCNGNVICLMFANQQIAAKYHYDPYGNMLAMSGPLAGCFDPPPPPAQPNTCPELTPPPPNPRRFNRCAVAAGGIGIGIGIGACLEYGWPILLAF